LKSDGTVLAWGLNVGGQVGDGTTTNRLMPVPVLESGLGPLTGIAAVSAGGLGTHSLALKSDGTVVAWGANDAGQLGDGTLAGGLTAVQVSGLGAGSEVAAVAAGNNFSLALFPLTTNGLGEIVDELTLHPDIKKALLAKLAQAQDALDRDQTLAAEHILGAFVDQVEAQRGQALTGAEADLLIAYANALVSLI
jgi:hypothetical protein